MKMIIDFRIIGCLTNYSRHMTEECSIEELESMSIVTFNQTTELHFIFQSPFAQKPTVRMKKTQTPNVTSMVDKEASG